jgi:TATA-box binding protein (TBP) (component of TFIID and TFIIIB)
MNFKILRMCKQDAMSNIKIDLTKTTLKLRESNYQVDTSDVMLIVRDRYHEVTIFRNGRLMIGPVKGKEDAKQIAEIIYSLCIEE